MEENIIGGGGGVFGVYERVKGKCEGELMRRRRGMEEKHCCSLLLV